MDRELRMAKLVYHLAQASKLAFDLEMRETITAWLRNSSWEKKVLIGRGGPVINVRLLDNHIMTFTLAEPVPVNVRRSLQIGRAWSETLLELQARKEPVTLLVT